MGRIVLIRHGETRLNKGGESAERIRGWKDIPLDADGEREAVRLADKLQKYDVRVVYSSPLGRARETAAQIAQKCKCPMRVNVSLLPWHLGEIQGEVVSKVMPQLKHYAANEDEAPRGGEPFATYRVRFLSFLKRKADEARTMPENEYIVLATHSRGLQCAKAWMAAGCPDDLHIDTQTMNDYSTEIGTGGMLSLRWAEDEESAA